MTIEQHTELTPNLVVLLYTVQDLIQKGWELDPDQPPNMVGFTYEAHFVRNDEQEPEEETVTAEFKPDVIITPEEAKEAPVKAKSPGRPAKVKK